ncbi:MAG: hypothetical protein WAN47_01860 [Nitrosotalea sp.]
MSDNLVNSVQQIIILGKGDRLRLEYILELLTKGKTLPTSDQKYLESIIPLYLGTQDAESLQKHMENVIDTLHGEIRTLNERLSRLERKGFEKYVGKKAIFFFATVFVGWHVFQSYTMSFLGPYLPSNIEQYLFPLNMLANSFNANSLVWLVFIFMAAAWPFIGAAYLAKFIKSHKNVSCTDKTINRCNIQETAGKLEGWGWNI